MKITVERIIALLLLSGELLLLPACKAQVVSGSNFSELYSSQPSENQPIETPARTPAEPRPESFTASDETEDLTNAHSLPPDIPEHTSNADNRVAATPETSAVPPSSSNEMGTVSQPASSPPEEATEPELSTLEPPDPLPPESSAAPSVEIMGRAYLCDLLSGVNSHRSNPLDMDAELSAIAQAHAEEMAQTKNLYHSCSGVESVGKGAFDDGIKEGSLLTVHCSDLASNEVLRIGVGAAKDDSGAIYVCILGKNY